MAIENRDAAVDIVQQCIREIIAADARRLRRNPKDYRPTPRDQYPFAVMERARIKKGYSISIVELARGLEPLQLDRNGWPNYFSRTSAINLLTQFDYEGKYGMDISRNPSRMRDKKTGRTRRTSFLGLAEGNNATRIKEQEKRRAEGHNRKVTRMEWYERNPQEIRRRRQALYRQIYG